MKIFAIQHTASGETFNQTAAPDTIRAVLRFLEIEGNGAFIEHLYAHMQKHGYRLVELSTSED